MQSQGPSNVNLSLVVCFFDVYRALRPFLRFTMTRPNRADHVVGLLLLQAAEGEIEIVGINDKRTYGGLERTSCVYFFPSHVGSKTNAFKGRGRGRGGVCFFI